ncbi:MAG: GDSL-type esterase/lipase family protein [Victivallales bacterium]
MNTSVLMGVAMFVPFCCAVGCLAAGNEELQTKKSKTIVVFGDSTTATRGKLEIYANLLARELPAKGIPVEIINAGIGGNNTQMAAARFEKDVLEKNPDMVVIQFGINDSAIDVWKNPPETEPRVSKGKYMQNLEKIIETLKSRKCGVILMTPNQLCWTQKLKETYGKPPYDANDPDGFNITLREYAQAVRQLAEKHKLPLVDIYTAYSAYGKVENQSINDLLLDGMHPNDKGQRLVADLLIEEIVKLNEANK